MEQFMSFLYLFTLPRNDLFFRWPTEGVWVVQCEPDRLVDEPAVFAIRRVSE